MNSIDHMEVYMDSDLLFIFIICLLIIITIGVQYVIANGEKVEEFLDKIIEKFNTKKKKRNNKEK